jgi:predicted glycoside hydrolase/deacetylase ChbG (UPF0249 family)
MKTLLCTTDDLGMCHAVNAGIVQAMTQGWARSSNLIAPAPWFNEAVQLCRERGLAVGVHLCSTCDWDRLGWGPLTGNPRLRTASGQLPATHEGLLESGATDEDLYDELKAQILLVKRAYGEPTHLDCHMAGGHWRGGIYDRLQAVIEQLSRDFRLPFTYARDRASGALTHFKDEACHSGWTREQLLAQLDAWTEPGAYHFFGHAAVDSDELDAICSPQHPSRAWAREYRVSDQALYLDASLVGEFEKRGFKRVDVAEAIAR